MRDFATFEQTPAIAIPSPARRQEKSHKLQISIRIGFGCNRRCKKKNSAQAATTEFKPTKRLRQRSNRGNRWLDRAQLGRQGKTPA